MKTLVLGVGNILLSDEGVGVHVVRLLQERYRFPQEVEILDGGTLGLNLLPYVENADRLVIVDAVQMNVPPGTLVRLEGAEVPAVLGLKYSSHQMGVSELLAVARVLGHSPAEVILLGIQPASLEVGLDLSPTVAAQVETLVQNVLAELQRWGIRPLDSPGSRGPHQEE
ncbi:MAG: HyaD/HybD family hydrogenase maturation endopeptidase [Anaerolineae bacterium]|nr:HyaD/HybD family hydrogenase maturation endopeptidase [Anaerolineae bacterium]MDW8067779.1 HyaD/HybD family hydrogenase maturation endopeptidase [Anaerolineae bacterium]